MIHADTVRTIVAKFAKQDTLADDEDVIAKGLIDSLLLFDLIEALETGLGVSIPLGDFTLDDFRTVASLTAKLKETA